MSSYKAFITITTLSLLIFLSFQHDCAHDHMEHPQLEIASHDEIDPATADSHRRNLEEWGPIRIHADYTHLEGNETVDPYIKTQLVPAAIDFWTKTLKVPTLTGIKVSPNRTTICGLETPPIYINTGVNADFVILFTAESSPLNWIAGASACILLDSTKRPVMAKVTFNYNYVYPSSQANFESHLMTTLHELTHTLGFSYTLYDYFPSKPTFKTTIINSVTSFYLDTPILTQKVKDHFNCPDVIGALLEQQGSGGSVGSHFERRVFSNEFMTASAIKDMRITQFTLGLLESSGWYQVDYSLIEPFYFGKNQGCGFYTGPCASNGQANYPGYCSQLTQYDCTFHRKIGGYCGNIMNRTNKNLKPSWNYWGDNRTVDDSFADNCPIVNQLKNIDCEDPNSAIRKIIAGETYEPGSKCFMGNLYPRTGLKRNMQYCLRYNCEAQPDGNFFLRLIVGTVESVCTVAGQVSVPGYAGTVECPDPNDFCSTVGIQFCKRGCLGRGTCQMDGTCVCNPGYSGPDCGFTNPL